MRKVFTFAVLVVCTSLAACDGSDSSAYRKLPEQETQFCKLHEEAAASYKTLQLKLKGAENNGIVREQVSHQLRAVDRSLDSDLRQFFAQSNSTFDAWIFAVDVIGRPGMGGVTLIYIHIPCTARINITADIPSSPTNMDFLSKQRPGDTFSANGRIEYRPGFDWSIYNIYYKATLSSVKA